MFRFTIRDVLWLTVVAAILCAWWLEWRSHVQARQRDAATIEALALQTSQRASVQTVRLNLSGRFPPAKSRGRTAAPDEWELQAPPSLPRTLDSLDLP